MAGARRFDTDTVRQRRRSSLGRDGTVIQDGIGATGVTRGARPGAVPDKEAPHPDRVRKAKADGHLAVRVNLLT